MDCLDACVPDNLLLKGNDRYGMVELRQFVTGLAFPESGDTMGKPLPNSFS